MGAYLLHVPATGGPAALARRVALLTRTRSVLVVTSRSTLEVLQEAYREAGADLSRVFILDAATGPLGSGRGDPEHAAFVPNPAFLEAITARVVKIIRTKAERDCTIVVDDARGFAQHASTEMLAEAVRYAVHSLLSPRNDVEYAFPAGFGGRLLDLLRPIVDGELSLQPDGQAVPLGGGG